MKHPDQLAADLIAEHAARLAEAAPPLSAETRDALAALLHPMALGLRRRRLERARAAARGGAANAYADRIGQRTPTTGRGTP